MLQRGSSISNNLSPQGLSAECDSTAPGSPCAFQMYWADFEALSTPLVVGCCAPPSTAVCMSVVRGGHHYLLGERVQTKLSLSLWLWRWMDGGCRASWSLGNDTCPVFSWITVFPDDPKGISCSLVSIWPRHLTRNISPNQNCATAMGLSKSHIWYPSESGGERPDPFQPKPILSDWPSAAVVFHLIIICLSGQLKTMSHGFFNSELLQFFHSAGN